MQPILGSGEVGNAALHLALARPVRCPAADPVPRDIKLGRKEVSQVVTVKHR